MTVASVRSDWAKASIGNRGHRLIGCVNRQTAVTPSRPLERVQAPIPALEADIAGGMKAFDAPGLATRTVKLINSGENRRCPHVKRAPGSPE